jgi:hypothetical protein
MEALQERAYKVDSAYGGQRRLFWQRPGALLRADGLLLESRVYAMKYRCQICERDIDEFVSIAHIKAEEYIMSLILRDHPEWVEDKLTCHKCLEYYRKLVKDAEI